MRRFLVLVAVCVTLLGGPVSAAPLIGPPVPKQIDQYAFWAAHWEDVGDLSGWKAVYAASHDTCESAIETTYIMAAADGWDVERMDPPVAAVVFAFPFVHPCSATLALR